MNSGDDDKFEPNRQERMLDRVGTYVLVIASIIFAIMGAIFFDVQKLFELKHSQSDDNNPSVFNLKSLGPITHEGHVKAKPTATARKHDKISSKDDDGSDDEIEGTLHCEKKLVKLDDGSRKVLEVCDWK